MDQDHEIVRRTLRGDLSAFDELVNKYQRPIYALCVHFIAHREDGRDLAQEVFLKAFEGLKNFRYQSSFRTWLYRIAINACINFSKSRQREYLRLSAARRQMTYTFSDTVEQAQNLQIVQSLAAQLPAKQRTAIILRLEQGLSYDEISEITGQTVSTVKTTVFYGLQKIKKLVHKPGGMAVRHLKHSESS